ncbi:hypothetical protein B0H14DRAFT_2719314, partial [Mycena olivaceomarginata]
MPASSRPTLVLQHTNHVFVTEVGPFCRANFAELPHEMLLMIFRHVLPPRWLLSGLQSLAAYPDDMLSADLRMKHSLLSVCKSWNQVGTELLYESVVLRRILQLPVFRLNLNCFPPRGYCQLYENGTRRILALCPNISHFGFSPPFLIPGFSSTLLALPSSITSLECNSNIAYPVLSDNLRSLTLAIPSTYDEGHPVLLFGRVEDLCLIMEPDSVVSPSKWLFPDLRKLWLNGYLDCHSGTPKRPKAKELIDAYGARITFLGLFPDYSIYGLHGLLSRCPVLEHLAVRQRWVPEIGPLASHTVKFVDIFTGWKDEPEYPISVEFLQDVFPALREVRTVGGGTSTEFRDLPLDMLKPPIRPDSDPELEEEDEIHATVMKFTNPHSNGCAMINECNLRSVSPADADDDSDAESCSTVSEDEDFSDEVSEDEDCSDEVSEDEDCSDEDLADEFYMGEDFRLG